MKVLATTRRNSLAVRFTALAIASFVLLLPAALLNLPLETRSLLAFAALAGYVYFAWRAMPLWQGRKPACLRRSKSWRRHFCGEPTAGTLVASKSLRGRDAHGAA